MRVSGMSDRTATKPKEHELTIAIDKGVPLPAKNTARGNLMGTLVALEVGDSFLFPKAKRNSLACYFGRIHGKKFTSRSVDEANVRVWRTE